MRLSPGSRLGPYEIRSLLGSGGMGEVYRAHDGRLGRDVALKVLPESVSNDRERLKRFEHEARAAAALNHPNILAVYDVGSHDGSPYIVAELLEGETLRERLRAGSLTIKEALDVASALARALSAAHEKGIVHRDIKPENLFLTRDGQVKVLDFGLAKLRPASLDVASESPTATQPTAEGRVLGTAYYMSPEQLRGQATDARSDIFSFGVVLYEMLAGRRPFQGESTADIMSSILNQDPPKLVELVTGISPLLGRIAERCLEKRPPDRYQSAHDLTIALEAVLGAETGERPAPSGARPTVGRSLRRRWVTAAAAILLGIGGAAGLGIWRWQSRTSGKRAPITSLAVLPLKNYSGDPAQDFFADGMTDALIAGLAQIRALKVISRTSVMQYKDTQKPLPEIARELKIEGIIEGSVVRSGSRVRVTAQLIDGRQDRHLWANNYEQEMTDVLALQGEVVRAITAEIRVQITAQEEERLAGQQAVVPAAYEAVLKGRLQLEHATTEREFRAAIELFTRATESDPRYAPGWAGLAEATWYLADLGFGFVPPDSVRDTAVAAAQRALDLDERLPEAHNARAVVAGGGEWDLEAAENHFQRALELRPGYAAAHNLFAQLLHMFPPRRFDASREHLRIARELDPFSPWNDVNSCFVLFSERRFDRAIEVSDQAIAQTPGSFLVRWCRGVAYMAAGKAEHAVAELEATIEPSGRNLDLIASLGLAYGKAGRSEDARRILRELQDLATQRYVSPYQLALVHMGLGQKDEAFRALERGLAERTPMMLNAWSDDPSSAFAFHGDARYEDLRARLNRLVRPPRGAAGARP